MPSRASIPAKQRIKPIAAELAKYGVVPRKSRIACAKFVQGSRHFWRGVIDGDGHLGIRPQKSRPYAGLALSGSKLLMEQFAEFVQGITPTTATVRPMKLTWVFTLGGSHAAAIVCALYADCGIAIPRKLETARRIIAMPPYEPRRPARRD